LGFFAPAATPPAALARYRQLVTDAMKKDSVRATVTQQGMAVDVKEAGPFAVFLQQDIARWADVIRSARVTMD